MPPLAPEPGTSASRSSGNRSISGDAAMIRTVSFALLAALAAFPAAAQQVTTPPPSGTGNPNLAVASVKLENGMRLSKVIGSTVYADPNTSIGTVDDLIMTPDNQVAMAIVSVGGFLGIGSKLVAIPYDQLKSEGGKAMLPGATKDSLNGMPNFTY
jgi:sporulation protein YlmC with PRC-barrel domain